MPNQSPNQSLVAKVVALAQHKRRAWLVLLGLASLLVLGFSPLFQYMRAAAAPPATQSAVSPDGLWQELARGRQANQKNLPAQARTLRLNREALERLLNRAPLEFTAAAKDATTLTLPMPEGSFERFRIEESSMMEPELAARFPEIKSYRAQGIDNPTATARLNWSPRGFYAFVLLSAGAVCIQPASADDATTYISYASQDLPADANELRCLVSEREQAQVNVARLAVPGAATASVGGTLRVYRVAIATTVEYTNQANLGGGTVGGTLTSLGIWLSGVNAILEKELAVRLLLVANNDLVTFTAEPDGFTNGDNSTMIGQVPGVLSTNIGVNNFDIGHVFGTTGSGSAGLAGVGVVCDNSLSGAGQRKARGSTLFSGPSGQSGQLGVLAHEFGHELGASHTFNALEASGNCVAANRSGGTAYETGSGSTLMSYGGICQTNNLSGKEFRLHAGSFAQITTVLNTATCNNGNWIATGNTVPTINAGGNFTIPKQTPFTLTVTGNDADAADVANLTYTWDQIDAGGASYPNPPYGDQPGDPNTTTRPLFRPFPATTSQARIFPSLTYILNNANVPPATVNGLVTGENLPNVARTLNFRATVRDNRGGGGGVNEGTVVLTVDGNSGPLSLTAPNTAVTWTGGTQQTVTWDVNNTNTLAANVKISLSTDGGQSFPTVLLANTPNDGSEAVTAPNGTLTTTARLKVEAVGNVFFDIGDANFSITPGDGCAAVSSIAPGVGNATSSVVITGINFTGTTAVKFSNNVNATFNVNSDTQLTATVPAGAITGPITISKTGCSDRMTGTFAVCPNPPSALQVDDGSVELATATGGGTGYYVNRLTPASYPVTLSRVSIQFANFQNVPAGTAITVLAGANPNGTTNINGTSFQTLAAQVGTLEQFANYDVAPLTITSGDFVVGFSIAQPGGSYPGLLDTTTNQGRSYASSSGSTFSVLSGGSAGNLFIRAQVFTGNCGLGSGGALAINSVTPPAGRVGGGQTITLVGSFANLQTVTIGGANATFTGNTTQITVTTPAHAAGAVDIVLTPTAGSTFTKTNGFAYLPTVFTDDTLVVGMTTAKAPHVLELRSAIDALRVVAGLGAASWTDLTLTPGGTLIKAVHITEVRSNLEAAAAALGYTAGSYTDPVLNSGVPLKRIHVEEPRQRIRMIAG